MLEVNKIENIPQTSQVKADQKQIDVRQFSQVQTQKYVKTTYEASQGDIAGFLQKYFPKKEFVAIFKGIAPNGKAIIQLGKYTFEAKLLAALDNIKEGDILVLKVKSLSPSIELELVDVIKERERVLRDYLKFTLLNILEGKESLEEAIGKLPIYFDLSKVDFKSLKEVLNLSQIELLKTLLEEHSKTFSPKTKEAIYELLSLIFLNTIQNRHLQFSLPIGEDASLDLHFYKEGEKYRFVMDFLIKDAFLKIEGILFLKDIYLLIKTNSKEFKQILEKTKHELVALLTKEGLKVNSINIYLEKEIQKEKPLNYIQLSEGILVDEEV